MLHAIDRCGGTAANGQRSARFQGEKLRRPKERTPSSQVRGHDHWDSIWTLEQLLNPTVFTEVSEALEAVSACFDPTE